jgi:Na+-transporting methylmalonyl-CoA/oxaloacetate decarboxylase gamma subunit
VGFVFALMILLAGVMTGIQAVVAAVDVLNVQPDTSRNYFEQFWASFAKILSLGGEATWRHRTRSLQSALIGNDRDTLDAGNSGFLARN